MLSLTNPSIVCGIAAWVGDGRGQRSAKSAKRMLHSSSGGGSQGAILLSNVPESLGFARTTLAKGATTNRWYPISIEKSEFIMTPTAPR
jgi:hypothetical protein